MIKVSLRGKGSLPLSRPKTVERGRRKKGQTKSLGASTLEAETENTQNKTRKPTGLQTVTENGHPIRVYEADGQL